MNSKSDARYHAYIGEAGNELRATLQKGLEFIDWTKYVNENSKVFVKPNFTFPYYRKGVTTTPELLRRLLEILKSKAGTVIVGESDGGNHSFTAEQAFEGHNMYQICREAGAELVNLSKLPSETIDAAILGKKVKVRLPKMLLEETDCFISVPVLKVHVMTTVSLSLKNLWGCVPDTMRFMQHQNLAHKLALIAKFVKPKIIVVDGTYALDKHGPMYGNSVRTNLVMVADNPVASDALGARIMGFTTEQVKHIAVAEKAGLGLSRLENIQIEGDWQRHRRQFTVSKTLIDRLSNVPFHSDALAKLILGSPLTPLIYTIATKLRSPEEQEIANQIGKRTLGQY